MSDFSEFENAESRSATGVAGRCEMGWRLKKTPALIPATRFDWELLPRFRYLHAPVPTGKASSSGILPGASFPFLGATPRFCSVFTSCQVSFPYLHKKADIWATVAQDCSTRSHRQFRACRLKCGFPIIHFFSLEVYIKNLTPYLGF